LSLIDDAKKDFQDGNNYFRDRKFDQAKASYSAALEKLTKCESANPQHALALSNLGVLEFGEGRFKEAKELLKRAIEERHRTIVESGKSEQKEQEGDGDNLTSITLALKRDMSFRQLPDAQRFLAGEIKDHATIDAMTSDLFNNLAACCEVIGDLQEAQQFYEESLMLRKIVDGERTIKVAESYQNIATILDFQGHQKEAEKLLEQALDIEVELYGSDSVESSVTLNNLAVLCEHLNKLEQAQSLLERCVAIRTAAYGADHHYTQSVRQNLDYVLNKRKSVEANGDGHKEKEKEQAVSAAAPTDK
jgi:tetratricopeptide (TPR) repeat protein